MSELEVQWEDPPDTAHRSHTERNRRFASELRQHPGKWAVWPDTFTGPSSASNIAAGIRRGTWVGGGGFEAVSRRVGDERRVYVRFVGEDA